MSAPGEPQAPTCSRTGDGAADASTGPSYSRAELVRVLDDPAQPVLVTQPIVDLARGTVAGYEALSRFRSGRPDRWFAAAAAHGMSAVLQARVIERALALRCALPPNTFLSVNVEPDDLLSDRVQSAFAGGGRLDRIVVELTEHNQITSVDALRAPLAWLRERGALIAADDVGAGYAGLQALLTLRPQVVKADRSLVDGIDRDPAKQAVLAMLGQLAGRMDAWLLAEGVERAAELVELIRLDVPLAQGFLLARPEAGMAHELPSPLRAQIVEEVRRKELGAVVASLIDVVPTLEDGMPPDRATTTAVPVDHLGRPTALWAHGRAVPEPLLVKGSEAIHDVALRMAARTGPDAMAPAVAIDSCGRAIGVVEPARLLARLATDPLAVR